MKKDDHWSPLQINYSEKIKMKYIAPLIGVLFQVKGVHIHWANTVRPYKYPVRNWYKCSKGLTT